MNKKKRGIMYFEGQLVICSKVDNYCIKNKCPHAIEHMNSDDCDCHFSTLKIDCNCGHCKPVKKDIKPVLDK